MAALWLNISQAQLARIERGRRIDDLGRLIQWAKIIRIPPDLLWFSLPGERLKVKEPEQVSALEANGKLVETSERTAAETAFRQAKLIKDHRGMSYDLDEEVMKRRAFLIGSAAAAGLGKVDASAAIEAIRQELNISLAGERADSNADEWNQIALDYGEVYSSVAPAELIEPLMVDMLGMQVALSRSEGAATHPDLHRAAALISAFTAQTISNMGQPLEARRWWRTAKSSADRSGDPYSMLWVRGREILWSIKSRPVPVVLRLIEEAEGATGNAPPDAALELIAVKAQALAFANRKLDALNALGELRNEAEKSSGGFSGNILTWGHERLHGTESFIYSRLGDLPKAETATADGIRLRAANGNPSIRHKAALQVDLAFALVGSGDVSGGLSHARATISGLPESQRAAHLVGDARKLLDNIPLSDQRSAGAREYREWVSSLAGSAK
jgi:transcriptional regulator with XRE-family HTH domain